MADLRNERHPVPMDSVGNPAERFNTGVFRNRNLVRAGFPFRADITMFQNNQPQIPPLRHFGVIAHERVRNRAARRFFGRHRGHDQTVFQGQISGLNRVI